ncbi:MAG: cobalt transporter CbiM [Gaiellales bacterium]|nr:MAG: cobalt transporter CbiM [Gaiellales bacterium]
MHIPDGYISPQTAGGLWALVVPAWYAAGYKVRRTLDARQAPLIAIGAAFTFIIMMFNIPLPGGTTGHAVGGTIVAIVIGPWAAVIAVSVALAIQALFFGDGGILALGANCFNIGFILPVTGYLTYRLIARGAAEGSARRWIAAGVGGWTGLNLAALLTAVVFGLQGELYTAADGSALYSPYGLATAIPAMMVPHLAVAGVVEAVMTSLVYIFLQRTNPALLQNYKTARAGGESRFELRPLIIGLALLLVCTPIGLLATGTAWGEWGADEVADEVGYVPEGMDRYAGAWTGLLPDYGFPAGEEGESLGEGAAETAGVVSVDAARKSAPAYLVSGVVGLALASVAALLSARFLFRGRQEGNRG